MKKFVAMALILCMMTGVLAGCGTAQGSHHSEHHHSDQCSSNCRY